MEVIPEKKDKYIQERTPKARTALQGFNDGKVGFAEMTEAHAN